MKGKRTRKELTQEERWDRADRKEEIRKYKKQQGQAAKDVSKVLAEERADAKVEQAKLACDEAVREAEQRLAEAREKARLNAEAKRQSSATAVEKPAEKPVAERPVEKSAPQVVVIIDD